MFSHNTWLIYGTACQTMLWMQKAIRKKKKSQKENWTADESTRELSLFTADQRPG